MAIWQYRCVSCGGVHEVSVRPTGEATLLRCIVTRQWNWHEPAAFLAPSVEVGVLRASASQAPSRARASGRPRSASTRRAAARRRVRPSRAGGSRKPTTRKARAKGRKR